MPSLLTTQFCFGSLECFLKGRRIWGILSHGSYKEYSAITELHIFKKIYFITFYCLIFSYNIFWFLSFFSPNCFQILPISLPTQLHVLCLSQTSKPTMEMKQNKTPKGKKHQPQQKKSTHKNMESLLYWSPVLEHETRHRVWLIVPLSLLWKPSFPLPGGINWK